MSTGNSLIAAPRARCNACCARLIEELPRGRAVEPPDPDGAEQARVEISSVDTHSAASAWVHGFPVRDATTCTAPHEPQRFVAPGILVDGPRRSGDPNVRAFVIRPKRAVAAADRTVTVRQPARLARNFDSNGAAVAS